ncbi:hypothetical protein CMI37_32890 [Candidatus Pacearchaeota archaeon]|nr:hypothetical protein [Candidatus Pacearchaeota archaeon]
MYLPNEDYIKSYSLDYLDYVRKQNCCVTGQQMPDVHHLEAIGTRGGRKEPNQRHFSAIPLCRDLHIEVHQIGLHKFQEKHNIQLWKEAYYYVAKWLLIKMDKAEIKPNIEEYDDKV